ncbi:MAG TPA: peptidoglycan-binding protein [Candidatus Omnitrophota bacterium]|nr:peptidoglycan-binding protein [Candidatus Omnitrophota bacterium]
MKSGPAHLKQIIFIVVALWAPFISGCDQLYRLLHKEGAEEKKIIGEAETLEKNPNIEEVQLLLKIYGYDPGPIDGLFGGRTRDAIKRFQEDNGLNPSRFVDQQTWEKLRIFKDNGLIVDGQLNVALIQKLLKAAGFNPGAADGALGAKTKATILAFQKAQQLKADGKVGYKTLTALLQYLSSSQQ